jgi:hypothetical protein
MSARLDSSPPHVLEVDHPDPGIFNPLAASVRGLVGVSARELDDILVQHQGAPSVELGHDAWSSPGGQSQIHRSGLAVWLSLRLVEVGVPVDEEQPMAPPSPHRQQVAEHDRAVATEHDWEIASVEHVAGRIREVVRVVAQRRRIQQPGGGITRRVVWRWHNAAGVARTDCVGETGLEERARKLSHARWKEPEH